jgi:hypothetical protein
VEIFNDDKTYFDDLDGGMSEVYRSYGNTRDGDLCILSYFKSRKQWLQEQRQKEEEQRQKEEERWSCEFKRTNWKPMSDQAWKNVKTYLDSAIDSALQTMQDDLPVVWDDDYES